MVKINRIYTKTGDDGSTGLVGGSRIGKDSDRMEACGDIDELNSFLGSARTLAENRESSLLERLAALQNELFDIGAELATPADEALDSALVADDLRVERLESWIDEYIADLPELRSFVLPGGTELNAVLHQCRAICRRAERTIIRLSRHEKVSPELIKCINRLSDLFFAMARFESHANRVEEYLWKPGGTSEEA